ncbi:MAG: hypothetical protein WCS69_04265 [Ignavibacteriaceae bacterium]|jgi:hypothetical protein
MKRLVIINVALVLFSFLSFNCATLLKGYEDTITLNNAPDSIRVVDQHGAEIFVKTQTVRILIPKDGGSFIDKTSKTISLRNNKYYTLHLKYQDKEKIVSLYPKIGFGWAFLDVLCAGIPLIIDMYTGSWNRFPDVDAAF